MRFHWLLVASQVMLRGIGGVMLCPKHTNVKQRNEA